MNVKVSATHKVTKARRRKSAKRANVKADGWAPLDLAKPLGVAELARHFKRSRISVHDLLVGIKPVGQRGKAKLYALADVQDALSPKPKVSVALRENVVVETARKLRLANDQREGRLVPVEKIAGAFSRCGTAIKGILTARLEREYPTFVAGLQPAEARVFGKRLADEILKEFASLAEEWRK